MTIINVGGHYSIGSPVAATGQFCVAPMVRKDSGIDSVDQLLAQAAAEPDTLLFGANLGAINHMAGIMLQDTEPGAAFRFVQIGGGTENFTALTGGQTNTTVLSGAEVVNFTLMPDGSENPESQIKPLAYTSPERNPRLPDLPTLKELGHGECARAGGPDAAYPELLRVPGVRAPVPQGRGAAAEPG